MVGRGGRSKGCFACRKRRLKCDEQKPTCKRCYTANFACEYPTISFITVRERHNHSEATKTRTILPQVTAKQPLTLRLTPLSLSDDVLIGYLRTTLFVPSDPNSTQHTTWAPFLAQLPAHPLASQCLVALSQAYFGREHRSSTISLQGSKNYVRSLSLLNASLQGFQANPRDDTLLAVMILNLYEMLVLTSPMGWIEHALGLGQMIQMRGSESFVNRQQLTLFEANRFIIILASLAANAPTYLSSAEWKYRPWQCHPNSKDMLQLLLDIFADVTTLKAATMTLHGPAQNEKLFEQVEDSLEALMRWRSKWDSLTALDVDEIKNPIESDQRVLPTVFRYNLVATATTSCLYDAIMIQTVRVHGNFASYVLATRRKILQDAAREICMSTDSQLRLLSPMTGQFFLLFPLRMAALALEETNSSLKIWVQSRLSSFAGAKSPWGVAQNLDQYGRVQMG